MPRKKFDALELAKEVIAEGYFSKRDNKEYKEASKHIENRDWDKLKEMGDESLLAISDYLNSNLSKKKGKVTYSLLDILFEMKSFKSVLTMKEVVGPFDFGIGGLDEILPRQAYSKIRDYMEYERRLADINRGESFQKVLSKGKLIVLCKGCNKPLFEEDWPDYDPKEHWTNQMWRKLDLEGEERFRSILKHIKRKRHFPSIKKSKEEILTGWYFLDYIYIPSLDKEEHFTIPANYEEHYFIEDVLLLFDRIDKKKPINIYVTYNLKECFNGVVRKQQPVLIAEFFGAKTLQKYCPDLLKTEEDIKRENIEQQKVEQYKYICNHAQKVLTDKSEKQISDLVKSFMKVQESLDDLAEEEIVERIGYYNPRQDFFLLGYKEREPNILLFILNELDNFRNINEILPANEIIELSRIIDPVKTILMSNKFFALRGVSVKILDQLKWEPKSDIEKAFFYTSLDVFSGSSFFSEFSDFDIRNEALLQPIRLVLTNIPSDRHYTWKFYEYNYSYLSELLSISIGEGFFDDQETTYTSYISFLGSIDDKKEYLPLLIDIIENHKKDVFEEFDWFKESIVRIVFETMKHYQMRDTLPLLFRYLSEFDRGQDDFSDIGYESDWLPNCLSYTFDCLVREILRIFAKHSKQLLFDLYSFIQKKSEGLFSSDLLKVDLELDGKISSYYKFILRGFYHLQMKDSDTLEIIKKLSESDLEDIQKIAKVILNDYIGSD